MASNEMIVTTGFAILVAGLCYYFTGRDIIRAHKQTTEMLSTQHNQTMDTLARELHGDFGSVLDVIKENGIQTRLSIDKSAQSTLEVIKKSHIAIKDELKELEKPS